MCELGHLYQRQLNEQPLVAALLVVDVALVHQLQCPVEEARVALLGLFAVAFALPFAHFEQRQSAFILGHKHVSDMAGKPCYEQPAVESLVYYAVQQHHNVRRTVLNAQVYDAEIVVRVEHIQVFNDLVIRDFALAEARCLVENGQCVAHTSIGFLGYHGECFVLAGYSLALGHAFQVANRIAHGHSLEVIDLATRQDSGQNLVLFGGCEDEHHVCGRLFECLQEGVERRCGQHMHLVNDEHLVATHLRRYPRLLHQGLYVLH